jgi:hypothetical protein
MQGIRGRKGAAAITHRHNIRATLIISLAICRKGIFYQQAIHFCTQLIQGIRGRKGAAAITHRHNTRATLIISLAICRKVTLYQHALRY